MRVIFFFVHWISAPSFLLMTTLVLVKRLTTPVPPLVTAVDLKRTWSPTQISVFSLELPNWISVFSSELSDWGCNIDNLSRTCLCQTLSLLSSWISLLILSWTGIYRQSFCLWKMFKQPTVLTALLCAPQGNNPITKDWEVVHNNSRYNFSFPQTMTLSYIVCGYVVVLSWHWGVHGNINPMHNICITPPGFCACFRIFNRSIWNKDIDQLYCT